MAAYAKVGVVFFPFVCEPRKAQRERCAHVLKANRAPAATAVMAQAMAKTQAL